MTRRLIVLLNSRQASVLDWRPGRMHWLGEFPTTQAGLTAFQSLLMLHSDSPVRVILDSVDEDYRVETLPHVRGLARDEMLSRKLKQVFRNSTFAGAWRQLREHDGRRDDRYLLAAVIDADWLKPWLAVIDNTQMPLEGITLLSIACQSLLKLLHIRESHALLAYRLGTGLRLSYYQDGLLRFSRLLAGETPTQGPGWAAEEISKTQLYLMGQRMLPREARLQVLLLDASGSLASALAPLNADPAFNARILDPHTLARALHMPDAFLSSAPEIAPLAAIAGEPLLLNLAPAELTRRYTEYRWQRAIHLTALAIGVAGIIFTGIQWLRTLDQNDENRQMQITQQQLEARNRDITRAFPPTPVSAEQLGETIALAQQLERARATPATTLVFLSRMLDNQPGITLKKISWQDAGLTTPAKPGERHIELDAELIPFDGNYRIAMTRIENFMAQLRKEVGVLEVVLIRSPVNTDSTAVLMGNTRNGNVPLQAAFTLKLRYRDAP
jgi:hypothetical protein